MPVSGKELQKSVLYYLPQFCDGKNVDLPCFTVFCCLTGKYVILTSEEIFLEIRNPFYFIQGHVVTFSLLVNRLPVFRLLTFLFMYLFTSIMDFFGTLALPAFTHVHLVTCLFQNKYYFTCVFVVVQTVIRAVETRKFCNLSAFFPFKHIFIP